MKHMLTAMAAVLAASAALAQEEISFPGRASDLPGGDLWTLTEFSEGCCTLDMNVQRFAGGEWRGGSGSSNASNYDWNVPVYAPANGEIAACWRNSPDNPEVGVKLASVDNSDNAGNGVAKTIFKGGNHVVIITDQGNAISLNHFKAGSIPAALCPSNADNTVDAPTMSKTGSFRDAAYIEPANRPRVREGQFIGRIGNSGNSGGPHLHWSMHEVTSVNAAGRETLGPSIPFRIRNAWAQGYREDRDVVADSWFRYRGSILGEAHLPRKKLLSPSPYLRRATGEAGAVKNAMDVVWTRTARAVTASIAANNGNLKLIVWDVGVNGITRRGSIELGAAKDVRLSEPASDRVLAAIRQSDDRLKMVAFRVTSGGGIVREGERLSGRIRDLDMATTGGSNPRSVTAIRDKDGNLKLIAWDIATSNGAVQRLGAANAGAVSSVAIAGAAPFTGVFVAARISGAKLRVIPWRLSSAGEFTRGDHVSAGTVGVDIDVASLGSGVAASMRDSDGKLRLITWDATSGGDIVGGSKGVATAGDVSQHRLVRSPLDGSSLTSVARGGDGRLYMIGWAVNPNGTDLRRIGSSRAGKVTGLAADAVVKTFSSLDPREFILTPVRDEDGELRLISWDANMEQG